MALITCKDCKKEISTDAERCPNCGARRRRNIGCLPIAIIMLFLACVFFAGGSHDPMPRAKTALPAAQRTALLKVIQLAKQNEVIKSATVSEDGRYLGVIVKSSFYALEYDAKVNLAGILWGYYNSQAGNDLGVLVFTDSHSNKEVGTYSHDVGLRLQ